MVSGYGAAPSHFGHLVGLRGWRDTDGHLISLFHHYEWTAGVNVADCARHLSSYNYSPPVPSHRSGAMCCSCGFYAFTHPDLDDDTHSRCYINAHSNITGIIEGWGVATVGTLGFRCEKARIACLIDAPLGVRSRYPTIPIMPSVDAAIAEFPLTEPHDFQPSAVEGSSS